MIERPSTTDGPRVMREVTAETAAHIPMTFGLYCVSGRKWCSVYQIESSPTFSARPACARSFR